MQLSTVKQNSCSVVGEVSKPTGIGLEALDGTIEALSAAAIGILSQPRPLAARQWRVKNHGKIDEEPKMELRWMGILKFAVTPMCEA